MLIGGTLLIISGEGVAQRVVYNTLRVIGIYIGMSDGC